MGNLINPLGGRVGIVNFWKTTWPILYNRKLQNSFFQLNFHLRFIFYNFFHQIFGHPENHFIPSVLHGLLLNLIINVWGFHNKNISIFIKFFDYKVAVKLLEVLKNKYFLQNLIYRLKQFFYLKNRLRGKFLKTYETKIELNFSKKIKFVHRYLLNLFFSKYKRYRIQTPLKKAIAFYYTLKKKIITNLGECLSQNYGNKSGIINKVKSREKMKKKIIKNAQIELKRDIHRNVRFRKIKFNSRIRKYIFRGINTSLDILHMRIKRWHNSIIFFTRPYLLFICNLYGFQKCFIFSLVSKSSISAGMIAKFMILKIKQGFKLNFVLNNVRRSLSRLAVKSSGYKLCLSGRFSRKQIATYRWVKVGKLTLNQQFAGVDYAHDENCTKFGLFGIKVWFFCP